uniref:BZIP domain-containing protein n=1 Tax=Ditylum brightwellii TaxID=49249 RepID=A0A7S1ZUB9_9STRA|mmetsp:Transcript_38615/g.57945  ORF Transcript_38615/g.57945 Transcript_38615/m.57945 type:complete len:153 (+) Transcript_38615:26-484(+)
MLHFLSAPMAFPTKRNRTQDEPPCSYPAAKRHCTNEDKKMKRIMANRRSARESRERRKHLEKNLNSAISKLTKDISQLEQENEELRRKIKTVIDLWKKRSTKSLQESEGLAPVTEEVRRNSMSQLLLVETKCTPQLYAHQLVLSALSTYQLC